MADMFYQLTEWATSKPARFSSSY